MQISILNCLFHYTDSVSAPQILSARVSESDVCDDNGCVVTVEWSEPFISCAGSVSQYVLSVTPPTSECQSGSGSRACMLMTDQTQYKLTLAIYGSDVHHHCQS